MTSFGNRVFADIISYIKMRSYWIRVDPKSNDWCPYRKSEDTQTHREKTAI